MRPRIPVLLAGLLAAGAMLVGCGAEAATPAVDQVPALASRLKSVDTAIAQHRYGSAREALMALAREARDAHDRGQLDAAQADRILAAVAGLLSELPKPTVAKPSPTPTPPPVDEERDDKRDDKRGEKRGDKPGKGSEKRDDD